MTARAFVSPEEAAWVFETTPRTIRTWVVEGKLRAAPRIGRKHRIYIESVAEQAGLTVERINAIIDAKERELETQTNKPGALPTALSSSLSR